MSTITVAEPAELVTMAQVAKILEPAGPHPDGKVTPWAARHAAERGIFGPVYRHGSTLLVERRYILDEVYDA